MRYFISIIIIFLFSAVGIYNTAFAEEENYYNIHEKGWHWYNDPVVEDPKDQSEDSDPIEQINTVRTTIQRALDKAVLYPTQENVKNYIDLQNQYTNQSMAFSKTWKEVLLNSPELDFSLKHPTNNIARQIESDQEKNSEDQAIISLSKQSGLFFFYRSSCAYCQRFSPVVKHFADQYGITVIPITTDGISLPEFPNSLMDQGQSNKFNVTVEPALFAVNPYTHQAYPIGYGLMSEADLKKRILDIATHFGKEEQHESI
jgi:conjugal transfer pilus assembly protein TraF